MKQHNMSIKYRSPKPPKPDPLKPPTGPSPCHTTYTTSSTNYHRPLSTSQTHASSDTCASGLKHWRAWWQGPKSGRTSDHHSPSSSSPASNKEKTAPKKLSTAYGTLRRAESMSWPTTCANVFKRTRRTDHQASTTRHSIQQTYHPQGHQRAPDLNKKGRPQSQKT